MTALLAATILAGAAAAVAVRPAGRDLLAQRGIAGSRQIPFAHAVGRPAMARPSFAAPWRRRRHVAARRAATVELCAAVAAELRSGAMTADAMQRAVLAVPGVCDDVARVARLGGDVSAALVAASLRTGAGGLARLAAAWTVSAQTGAALADGCERIADWLRDDEAVRREVAAQLAGARTSARILAGLPVVGILLGTSMGARPLDVLLRTPYGVVCLGLGAGLAATGLWWTERLARNVEDRV